VLRGALLIGCVAAALVGAPASQARRAATPAERGAMAEGAGVPVECSVALVSTVSDSYGSLRSTETAGCPRADGTIALERTGDFWEDIADLEADRSSVCPARIPARVARDLGFCRPPKTTILCRRETAARGLGRTLRSKPRACDTLGPDQSSSQAANLARLKWRGWGHGVARARGIAQGYRRPYLRRRVRVKAYRLRRCPGGDFIYTRLKTRTKHGARVIRFPAACSD
jgi:hypothetical protein